jgi:hypothetical protein
MLQAHVLRGHTGHLGGAAVRLLEGEDEIPEVVVLDRAEHLPPLVRRQQALPATSRGFFEGAERVFRDEPFPFGPVERRLTVTMPQRRLPSPQPSCGSSQRFTWNGLRSATASLP